MGLVDFHLKLKALQLIRFIGGGNGGGRRKKELELAPAPWMTPVSHGYHVVENQMSRGGDSDEWESDSVVVQREQMEQLELWLFGVSDARVGNGITKYLQSHFFGKKLKQSHLRRKSKETMRRAYLNARAKMREANKEEDELIVGSASAMVINGEKLVMANMGDYRAVVCRDGVAYQIGRQHHQLLSRHWPRRLIAGAIRMPKVRILACDSGNAAGAKASKSSELVVGTTVIDSDTEFVILASTGIWEVMRNQEAVSLIRHMEDPQEAAECLAREALSRMSKSNISCLVMRFD